MKLKSSVSSLCLSQCCHIRGEGSARDAEGAVLCLHGSVSCLSTPRPQRGRSHSHSPQQTILGPSLTTFSCPGSGFSSSQLYVTTSRHVPLSGGFPCLVRGPHVPCPDRGYTCGQQRALGFHPARRPSCCMHISFITDIRCFRPQNIS